MELNVRPTTSRKATSSTPGSMAASVTTNESIVAMFGWIIPAPLAHPATRTVFPPFVPPMRQLAAARFGRVSVVMIARVSPSKAPGENASDLARPGTAFRMRSTGSGTPITPVEQTTTCCAPQPSVSATRSAVAREATMPPGPTEQLALPELTMMARIAPAEARTCSRERTTGGACTRFCVNTAAADAGGSETISATSSVPVWPRFFRPAEADAKRNPRGRARADGSSVIFLSRCGICCSLHGPAAKDVLNPNLNVTAEAVTHSEFPAVQATQYLCQQNTSR